MYLLERFEVARHRGAQEMYSLWHLVRVSLDEHLHWRYVLSVMRPLFHLMI